MCLRDVRTFPSRRGRRRRDPTARADLSRSPLSPSRPSGGSPAANGPRCSDGSTRRCDPSAPCARRTARGTLALLPPLLGDGHARIDARGPSDDHDSSRVVATCQTVGPSSRGVLPCPSTGSSSPHASSRSKSGTSPSCSSRPTTSPTGRRRRGRPRRRGRLRPGGRAGHRRALGGYRRAVLAGAALRPDRRPGRPPPDRRERTCSSPTP